MALSREQWEKFLKEAGIPDQPAKNYARTFVENRIQQPDDLDKETLKDDLHITTIGDILAIMKHAKSSAPSKSHFKPKIDLPTLCHDITPAQFRKFKTDWEVYKSITLLPPEQIAPQLYTACDPELQNSVINTSTTFFHDTEETNFELLEGLVTKKSNPAVHRLTFGNLCQSENETINSFVVRVKSASKDCQFECPECKHDLADIHIKDQVIRGLKNSALQTDILAKAEKLTSLDEVIKHAQSYEAAICDQSKISDTTEAVHKLSDYKQGARAKEKNYQKSFNRFHNKGENPENNFKPRKSRSCFYCGASKYCFNRSQCPAVDHKCKRCGVIGHFEKVCRTQKAREIREHNEEDDYPSSVGSLHMPKQEEEEEPALVAPLRMINNKYTSVSSISTEEISVTIQPRRANGDPLKTRSNVMVFPDSGASICLAGSHHLETLKIRSEDLTPCQKKVSAVGGSTLVCRGYILTDFTINQKTTRQKLYVCDHVDRIYFSKAACIDVGILPRCFPHPMEPDDFDVKTRPDNHSVNVVQTRTGEQMSAWQQQGPEASMPYPPEEKYVDKIKDSLINQFPCVFNKSTPFQAMKCEPVHIHLRKDAKPWAIHRPFQIPLCWKDEVKASLDRDVRDGIIEEVPIGEPVTWCSPMIVVQKKDGRPRRTIDFQKLNSQCDRETHHCQSPFQLALQVPNGTKKTVLDATDGYHSIPLDDTSKPLTTFITEWGRYRYRRLPQGYVAAGDAYTRRYDSIITGVENKVKCVDDTLLWSNSIKEAYIQTKQYLQVCQDNGITLNKEKFVFCQDSVEFAGLHLTKDGIQPNEKILKAIKDFPTPSDITGARSWFGLVNQVAWAYSMQDTMQPFRDLVKPKATFYWDQQLEDLFNQSKDVIIAKVIEGIRTFDPKKRTCLQTDWSKEGMGYLLLQKTCQCPQTSNPTCCKEGWHLVFAGSRFTKGAEARYAPTEGELLAVSWSLEHARIFVLGCSDLFISTDHKPLEGILQDRSLGSISNPRILNLKQKTLPFRFQVVYNPGKWHRGPDALSRNPTPQTTIQAIFTDDDPFIEDEAQVQIISEKIQSILTTTSELRQAAMTDTEYQDLFKRVSQGFPQNRDDLPSHLKAYWNIRHRLSVEQPFINFEERVIIPKSIRGKVLDNLHAAHQGVSNMLNRANASIYWPGIDSDVHNKRFSCHHCNERAPSQPKEPYCQSPSPSYPFQQICIDLFQIGHHQYASCVDRFTGWPLIYHMKQATGKHIVTICREIAAVYGVPEEISSDGGPQFSSTEFQCFLHNWDIHHRLSSAHYPQSNGRAELGVKTAKRILMNNCNPDGSLDNDKVLKALLQYKNTPLRGIGLSPAQLLLHRQLRDKIPTHSKMLQPHKEWIVAGNEREKAFAKQNKDTATTYNEHSKELKPLKCKTQVIIQEQGRWFKIGRVVEVLPNRQYLVRLEGSGRLTLRNRRFLKPLQQTPKFIPSPSVPNNPPKYAPNHQTDTPGPDTHAPPPIPPTINIPLQTDVSTAPATTTDKKKSNRILDQLADHNTKGLSESEVYPRPRLRGGKDY